MILGSRSVGFTLGFLDLSHFPLLAWLGGGQFRKFCMVIILILGATVWLTCWTTVEVARVLELGERPTCVFETLSVLASHFSPADIRSTRDLQQAQGHSRQPLQGRPSPATPDSARLLRPGLCLHVLGKAAASSSGPPVTQLRPR
jgi:hypothetical protein